LVDAENHQYSEENPTLAEFVSHWKDLLAGRPDIDSLVAQFPRLMEQYPVADEAKDELPPAATIIEDMKAFKAGLQKADIIGPMVQWGDLPVSKF